MEYLFSGGVDTQVCWSNVKTFANQKAKCTYKKSNAGGVNQVQKVKGSKTIFIFFRIKFLDEIICIYISVTFLTNDTSLSSVNYLFLIGYDQEHASYFSLQCQSQPAASLSAASHSFEIVETRR